MKRYSEKPVALGLGSVTEYKITVLISFRLKQKLEVDEVEKFNCN